MHFFEICGFRVELAGWRIIVSSMNLFSPDKIKLRLQALLFIFALTVVNAEVVTVQILQTTDLHGRILDDPETGSSWLRLATVIEQKRDEYGEENVLLIDCGDTVQGSFEAAYTRGMIAARLINALDYDVWVPGNHEIDFGTDRFLELVQAAGREKVVCANFRVSTMDGASGLQTSVMKDFPGWRMFNVNGANIAVIGATSHYLDNWHWGREVNNYEVETIMSHLDVVLAEINRNRDVDMIVLAVHQGWAPYDDRGVNEISEIVEKHPAIDLILGAHTHRTLPGLALGKGVWYVQAGEHANALGIVEAMIDTEKHETLNLRSHIIDVTDEIPVSQTALAGIRDLHDDALEQSQREIGKIEFEISGAGSPGVDCATSELICKALTRATAAQFAIHGRLSGCSLMPGEVNERDLFELVPYENGVALAALTPAEIGAIVEEQYANRNSYVACGIYGFHARLDAGGRVQKLSDRSGAPLDSDKRYNVVFNSYTVAGGGGRFPVLRRILRTPQAYLKDTGLKTRDVVRDYLKTHSGAKVNAVTKWLHLP